MEDWTVVGSDGELLGHSVAGAGDLNGDGFADVIVGAPDHNANSNSAKEGIVRVYHGGGPGVLPTTPSWTFVGDFFDGYWEVGDGVAGAGDVNGDGFDDVIVVADSGSDEQLLGFYGSPTGLGSTFGWIREFGFLFTSGRSIDGAGDMNGDGFDDIVVGAGSEAFVYFGSSAGLGDASVTLPPSAPPSGQFGQAVAGAGDIDGDGFDDIVIGDSNGALVYFGSPGGPSRRTILTGGQPGEDFGDGVSAAGDIDGDGFADVLVAAQGSTSSGLPGRLYLYLGQAGGIATTPSQIVEAPDDSRFFGRSLARAGNLDGGGEEILVGSVSVAVPSRRYVQSFSGPEPGPPVPAVGPAGRWMLVAVVLATAVLLYRRPRREA